jgi:hypothetical protein
MELAQWWREEGLCLGNEHWAIAAHSNTLSELRYGKKF